MKKYKLIKTYPGMKYDPSNLIFSTDPDRANYPEFWEEVKEPIFKVGDWVTRLHEPDNKFLARITKIEGSDYTYTGFDWKGNWFENVIIPDMYSGKDRLATPQEIETHLIAEAKKRGFIKGVNYEYPDKLNLGIRTIESNEFGYNPHLEMLYDVKAKNGIYNEGKWAEIVKEEEIKIGGYNTTIEDNMFWVGCRSFSFEKIKELYSIICYFGIESISIGDTKVTSDIVKKVLDKIDRQ